MQASRTRRAITALLLAATTAVAGHALANPPGGGPGRRGDPLGRIERAVERLDLDPGTRKAVYAALDEARTQRRALGDQLRTAHQQMKAALDGASPSLDAVLAQADSIGALETQARKIDLSAMVKIRQLLTDAQWKELQQARGPGGPGRCKGDAPSAA